MAIMNFYDSETIQQQPKYRRTFDIMAAILKVVISGEGTKRGIENGANLSFLQMKQYLLLLLTSGISFIDVQAAQYFWAVIFPAYRLVNKIHLPHHSKL
jgi:predicted transcriptional regulator